jgi:hypothetical protein
MGPDRSRPSATALNDAPSGQLVGSLTRMRATCSMFSICPRWSRKALFVTEFLCLIEGCLRSARLPPCTVGGITIRRCWWHPYSVRGVRPTLNHSIGNEDNKYGYESDHNSFQLLQPCPFFFHVHWIYRQKIRGKSVYSPDCNRFITNSPSLASLNAALSRRLDRIPRRNLARSTRRGSSHVP